MLIKTLETAFKVKNISDKGEFSGYGSVFYEKDSYSDIVVPGAFVESLKQKMPAMLWQHDRREPIGVWQIAREDDHGLYVEGKLLIDDDPLAKRAHAHMKAGSLTGLSIGYRLDDNGYEYDAQREAWILKKVDLWEISPVTFPANELARVEDVKTAFSKNQIPQPKIIEKLLRDAGFSRTQAKTFMSKGFNALRDAESSELTLDDIKKTFLNLI